MIVQGNALSLPFRSETVDCIVTSPPYNCGMEYAGVSDSFDPGEYEAMAQGAAGEMARVLKPGGRLWLNCLHNLPTYDDLDLLREAKGTGKKPAQMLGERANPFLLWQVELSKHLKYRDVVVWSQVGADAATAWGSALSPNAPNLRGRWEPILLMFKDTWKRGRVERNEMTWEQFPTYTRNVWEMPSAPRNGHPAPFGQELPRRCILLSTWPGDVVLDPFVGSGTTVKVAKDLGRVGVGADLSFKYCEMSRNRSAQEVLAV